MDHKARRRAVRIVRRAALTARRPAGIRDRLTARRGNNRERARKAALLAALIVRRDNQAVLIVRKVNQAAGLPAHPQQAALRQADVRRLADSAHRKGKTISAIRIAIGIKRAAVAIRASIAAVIVPAAAANRRGHRRRV